MNQKINLQGEVKSGYWNISTQPSLLQVSDPPDHTEFAVGQYWALDPIVPNDFAEEIVFSPPINLVDSNSLPGFLVHMHTKLKQGGVFKCHLIDIKRVGKAAYNGLGLQELSDLIFGKQGELKTVVCGNILQRVLVNLGFQLNTVSVHQFITTIEASKC